jgi:hypothetical protein
MGGDALTEHGFGHGQAIGIPSMILLRLKKEFFS